ncbi:hypothetical protein [Jiella pelagia]|uniref:Uncharacterized protein n=1 Tax=Jiella pelagia TaxID=2986949 RepID=A0ABY7BWZ0_9HYPH|nr:hypothetical protein [Jiella pelagia]WAP67947.1 hypothetical protein OH818_21330 [Jiella pelagia]
MRPEEGYDGRRRSGLTLQFVLLVMFLAVVFGAIWIYEGDMVGSPPGQGPGSTPAPATAPQPVT